jgi:hypothetical protein
LGELISRVREGREISDLLASDGDVDLVADKLCPLTGGPSAIESIAGSRDRVDAVVTGPDVHARVVFAHDAAGLLTWLAVYQRPGRFDGVDGGRVIVAKGPSGAGKSTLMWALHWWCSTSPNRSARCNPAT